MALVCACLAAWWWMPAARPRARAPQETPVAFWAWREAMPSAQSWVAASQATGALVLFARAGQWDWHEGRWQRVRAAQGKWPPVSELHLVYNATRDGLAQLEKLDAALFAKEIAAVFAADKTRAETEGAKVAGLQLDIDAPTRLLPNYAELLRAIRAAIGPAVKLSVTGLPTWMDSAMLPQVLAEVDFWTPQCYGGRIPQRLDDAQPIAAPDEVTRSVARARALGKPFYAGLAAYGYTLLYDADGRLGELRGDLNPTRFAADERLEMIGKQAFESRDGVATGAWRYVFRAREAGVLDGLAWRAGETLVFAAPSVESLRQTARAARAEGGAGMLGLCVFRLPETDDAANLSAPQIAEALADKPSAPSPTAILTNLTPAHQVPNENTRAWHLAVTNNTTTDALLGDSALVVTLFVPPGQARVSAWDGFQRVEYLCGNAPENAAPCSERRANFLRLSARAWPAGQSFKVEITGETAPNKLRLAAHWQTGRRWAEERKLTLEGAKVP